jgi:hypothetical protein
MSSGFLVFFQSGTCNLDDAARVLSGNGLNIRKESNHLYAKRQGSPEFKICLSEEPWVIQEAMEIGDETPFADAMHKCDARFEVDIDNLDEALDEINTMMEIQAALQEVSKGYLFLQWNGELSGL